MSGTFYFCSIVGPLLVVVAPIKETAFRRVNFITVLDNHSFGWSSSTNCHLGKDIWTRVGFVDGLFLRSKSWPSEEFSCPFLLKETGRE